jgi:hypothetical protein
LRSNIHYDPTTGIWTWKISHQRGYVKKGKRAGNLCKTSGYRRICINHILYRSSRLAWFYMTGEWPSTDVDHENNDMSDDRWRNLRLATDSNNGMNQSLRNDNTSGFKGVCYMKSCGQYMARIGVNSRKIYLGIFYTKELRGHSLSQCCDQISWRICQGATITQERSILMRRQPPHFTSIP